MSNCETITEFIPAFVLGALDTDEATRVAAHVAACTTCRDEAESFREVVGLMPYSAGALDPPPRVKQQLFARIAASVAVKAPPPPAAQPTIQPRPSRSIQWSRPALAFSLALAIMLGGVAFEARSRVAILETELAANHQALALAETQLSSAQQAEQTSEAQLMASQAQLSAIQAQLADSQRELLAMQENNQQGEQLVSFIAAPQTVSQPLGTTVRAPHQASARMFMQPGHNRLVLLIYGLESATPGKVYRLWLAKANQALAIGTLIVDADGVAEIALEAPEPMDTYDQVMITLDEADTVVRPSDEIIFEAEL